ncbi:MAG: plasmid replication protein, CyRepA1 family [Cyanobacteria bacterium J06648_1]
MDTDRTTTTNNVPNSINQASEQLQPRHLTEWQNSSVTGNLTTLNIVSLSGLTTHDYLLYALPDKDRRNDGRLRDKLLQRYQHLEHGGWYIAGLDPDSNWIDVMAWGRLKPDAPRTGTGGKLIKYESPPKTPNRVTYFRVPLSIWSQVASRYGIKLYHSPLALRLSARKQPVNFWEWVKNTPSIPILLTEGEKKAGSLLSQGYAAISLPGIWGGRAKSEEKELHPDLLPLAQPGRTFIILFDYDQKQSTREAVYKATLATGKAIEDAGCKCKVALLPGPEKGVDDFISARGDSAAGHLSRIINNAHSLEAYKWIGNPSDDELIKYAPDDALCIPYLPDSQAIDLNAPGLTGIKSEMATGKTSLVKNYRLKNPDQRFLVIGHRITLLRELSQPNKLNSNMYSDLSQSQLDKVDALSITVDSLYKLKTAGNKYECIFLDEARQVMIHALSASTCKQYRHEILMTLQYFIRSAKRVIIADAHLDDNTIDFFRAMRSSDEFPLIIKNEYQNPGRDVYYYQGADSSALVAKLIAAVKQGKKVKVVSDSKKTILKLEEVLREKLNGKGFEADDVDYQNLSRKQKKKQKNQARKRNKKKVIWTIHADNSGTKENQHFIQNISTEVNKVDVLLASPSLCTGVDIQGDRFDEVYGFLNVLSLSATDCLQALHRYRKQVPLHVWVAPRPCFGYQNTNPHVIKQEMLRLNEFNGFLMGIDMETGAKSPVNGWAFDAYCEAVAKKNRSLNNLRDHLHRLLARMGYNVMLVEGDTNDDAKADLKLASKKIDEQHTKKITEAEKIDRSQYQELKNKPNITPDEQYEIERFRIEDGYGQEVTEELVKKDKGGSLLGQLISLEALLSLPQGEMVDPNTNQKRPIPPKIVTDRDEWELDNLPFLPDRQHHCAQWMMWHVLGLPKIVEGLFAGGEYTAKDPELIKLAELAYSYRDNIKSILGFWIPDNSSPTWILGVFLGKMGLKTANRKKGGAGQQVKFYSLTVESMAFAAQVLEYRHQQRLKREERKRQRQEENRLHQMMLSTQYGIGNDSISPPSENKNIANKEEGVNMLESQPSSVLDRIEPGISLLETINLWLEMIKSSLGEVSLTNWIQKLLVNQIGARLILLL